MRVVPERQRARWFVEVALGASLLWVIELSVLGRWGSVGRPMRDVVIVGAVGIVVGGGCWQRLSQAAARHRPLPPGAFERQSPGSARVIVCVSALLLATATVAFGVVMPAVLAGVLAYAFVVRRAEETYGVQLWRDAAWRSSFGADPAELYCTGARSTSGDSSRRLRVPRHHTA
jgi:hypothetical protein